MLHGKIVDEITCFEIISCVQNQAGLAQQCVRVLRCEIGDLGLHLHIRVEGGDLARRGNRLRQGFGGIGFVKQ